MAIFTYQLAYFFWVKLEQDETRAEMQGNPPPRPRMRSYILAINIAN
jgi:hypothetical protein